MPAQHTNSSRTLAMLDTSAHPALNMVLEATNTGLWTWDVSSDLVRWSPETYRIHGLAPGEFAGTGEAFFWLVHPDDRARVRETVHAAVREGRPYSAEFRIVRPDGSIRRVTNRGRAEYDAAGVWTAVLGTITDITEFAADAREPGDYPADRSHAPSGTSDDGVDGSESSGAMAVRPVRPRVEFDYHARVFQTLIESNPFGVYVVDADFRLAYVSKGSRKVFENVRPLQGRDFAEVLRTIWPEPAATDFIERFRHTLSSGEKYEAPATVERRHDIAATEAYDWRIERIALPDGRYGVICYFYDLSERQQYEAKLRESESTLRLALEAAGMSLWHADLRAGRFEPSAGAAALHGENRSDWTLDAAGTVVVPEDRAAVRESLERIAECGGSFQHEYRSRWPDGSVHCIATAARAVLDDAGQPTGRVVGTVRDVTARRAAETERERTRALLDAVLSSIPAGVMIADANGRLIRWNRANEDLWGLHGSGAESTTNIDAHGEWKGWWYPGGARLAPHEWAMARALQQRGVVTGDLVEIERFDGSGRRVIVNMGAPVVDADGALLGAVVVQTDVTERVRAEHALETSEARLRAATEAADLGIHEFYPASGVILWDARLRALWGVPAEVPITYDLFMSAIHPDDRAVVQRCVDTALDPDGNGRYEAEYRIRNAVDGVERWVCATGRVTFEARTPVRLIGTVQDITAQKEAQARLLRADRQKDVFLATLSHELRNPLAPIRTAAHLLGNGGLQPEQLSWAQSLIQRQVAHMARLLDDLMDVSRITQGKLTLKREAVSLASAVASAAETAQPLIDRKRHRLSITPPEPDLVLEADPVRLTQILSNLLTNAAKYTDAGGHIDVVAFRDGADVVIEVRDDGIGLSTDSLQTLFEMFAQADGAHARAEGGLGIGLALVKGLVELHGGAIHARSAGIGSGSTFTVRLPLAPRGHVDDAVAPESRFVRVRRVLIADDNRDGADALAMAIQLAGHVVRVAYDGCAALSAAQEFRPEVALLDLSMPGMNGHALARALRAEPWGGDVLLCALSGWGQDHDRARAAEAGFDHHFTKPIDVDAIEALLDESG